MVIPGLSSIHQNQEGRHDEKIELFSQDGFSEPYGIQASSVMMRASR